MWDILSFNTFITKYVLVFFYYFFALAVPLAFFLIRDKFFKKYPSLKKRSWIILLILFLMYELFIRMFFEILIGYFDMHDYLHTISKNLLS